MRTSESIKNIAGAVMELQNQVPYIGKDSEGYGYSYTSLPAFNKKVYPKMKELGLSISCATDHMNGEPALTTLLVHVPTGEFYESSIPMVKAGIAKANDAQQFGAAITYMCRYSIKAILGIASDDDDAECLTDKPEQKQEQPKPEPPTAGQILKAVQKAPTFARLEEIEAGARNQDLWSDELDNAMLDRKLALERQEEDRKNGNQS